MTVSVELTDARLDALREKRASIRDRFDSVELDDGTVDSVFEPVTEAFDRAETRRGDFESANEQRPESEVTQKLYKEYLRSLSRLSMQLRSLQWESLYFDLHEHQQSDERSGALERTLAVCEELRCEFDISPTIFPVVNDGYAVTPIGHGLPSTIDGTEVYVLELPRESTLERYEPLLMHELGHVLLDHRSELRHEARKTARDRESEMDGIDNLRDTWEVWFEELFCDVCGVVGYGPAYLCALLRRLSGPDPFALHVGDEVGHPPDALRFEVIHELARRDFPDLLDAIEADVTAFEQHLAAFENDKSANYDVYDDDSLFRFVVDEVPEAVGGDLDALLDDIGEGVEPSASAERQYRLEANRRLLPSYPPQKGG